MVLMKNIFLIIVLFVFSLFFTTCKDAKENHNQEYAVFLQETLNVSNEGGEVVANVEWNSAEWEIDWDEGGFVTSVSPKSGGGNEKGRHYTTVKLVYNANFDIESRNQKITLKNLDTGEISTLDIFQNGIGIQSSDNGDGTFTNPILWLDAPDPDVIRVGDYFYMVNTTMHMMPGAAILRSRDLVNWEIVSYVYDSLNIKEDYSLQNGKTVYGRGQWATSLRYHAGKFYVFFSPNDTPWEGYVYSTENPESGWVLLATTPHYHDASLFFDDDGKIYLFYGSGRIVQLSSDFKSTIGEAEVLRGVADDEEEMAQGGLLEGNRAIKHNGKYYLLMVSWPNGKGKRQVCFRSDNIKGPYEKKVILEDMFDGYSYVAQGCIVDGGNGDWYGMVMQDRSGVGRVVDLMPCRWIDGWPMLGDENGKVPAIMEKPVQGSSPTGIVASDDFNHSDMLINWQWNHNPVNEAWSLTERSGFLRLKTSCVSDNIFLARNTMTQRMEGPQCSASVSLDVSNMKDGDVAGFGAFNGTSGLLKIEKKDGKCYLSMTSETVRFQEGNKVVSGIMETQLADAVQLYQNTIYLRIDADFRLGRTKDVAKFYYSFNNKEWTRIGGDFKMTFDYTLLFVGTRFAIFNYATEVTGGYVDIDFFNYRRIKE